MPSIGPTLPPHLSKRKRDDEDLKPTTSAASSSQTSRSPSLDSTDKKRRTIGPAPPPAPLSQRPPSPPSPNQASDDSSSDDDFGPRPPPAGSTDPHDVTSAFDRDEGIVPEADTKPQRDEWMTIPPQQDDLAARMDPTKRPARKFKGKGAPGAGEGIGSAWTETAEEKRKRLADQVMGRMDPEAGRKGRQAEEEGVRRGRERVGEKGRGEGKSLYDRHQEKKDREKEDDPSGRAFDYEKDMGTGMKIGHAQKKEMLHRAADMGSRFSGGGYL
ncbi:hypothetical protein P152DRAFT_468860 [Eremomyces bilateralis CBS 781.70]|uniref:DUF3752 domain-containing protein n=1 Tax=Eremomyces bilateralis CBS 781.70 TaxID=1392243 RepID=A0A6G1FSF6_9PEZI|nr:uncharacterized protein P152DRAFT_468860 [Eremomyces bilateralis CBS 781.70]KAF1808717.1 hypothetical protein P152DRAFT_468860 [Eremomyces bilateralis CBS 781.70]